MYLDHTQIDTRRPGRTALIFDSLDRPQMAYTLWDDSLKFRCFEAGVWRVFDLQVPNVSALDIVPDRDAQPLIAYTTSAGVFIAHGVDVVGQADEPRPSPRLTPVLRPTVVRGVMYLPKGTSSSPSPSCLLDISGRIVMALLPGPNDVRALAPGVYFVRQASGVRRDAASVTKVVVTR
jgi:hypothetical protein